MADIGIKASIAGADVNTCDEKDLILSSKRKCLKVNSVVHDTIDVDSSGIGTKTITHNLGFVPVIFLLIKYKGGYYFSPANLYPTVYLYLYTTADRANFTVSVATFFDVNQTYDIYYWLSETESAE